MSTRTKILLLTVPAVFLLVGAFSALLLNNLVASNLQNSRHLAQLALQQTKEVLLIRLEEASRSGAATREKWVEAIAGDQRLANYLVNSVAQAPSLVEISVAGADNKILLSSTQSIAGTEMRPRPSLYGLLALGPIDRLRRVRNQSQDYELQIPIGRLDEPTPIFKIQVLVSMALVNDLIHGGLQWIGVASLITLAVSLLFVSLLAGFVSRDLRRIEQDIDLIRKGEAVPVTVPNSSPEFAAVQSKLSLLGAELRDSARSAAGFRTGVSAALERLEEGILLFDEKGQLILSSGASQRLLGCAAEDFKAGGTPLETLLTGGDSHSEKLIEWPGPTGLTPLLAQVDRFADSHVLVRLRDPEGRRELESKFDLLSRLDSINRLTGGVAHEIKNPLNSIATRLALLESTAGAESEEAQEEIRIINEEVLRLDRVVRTFLDFTRPVELAQEEVDLTGLVDEVTSLIRPDAQRRSIIVRWEPEGDHAHVWGDPDILRQALMNLAVNAFDAMPEGGTLAFAVSNRSGREVQLRVADTGSGMTEQQRAKIFQLYFTTKKNGSGIGLAMVYRAVQLHGGNIEVDSEPGKGARFDLTFPAFVRS